MTTVLDMLAPLLREFPKTWRRQPPLCGVYLLIRSETIVYVGQSINIGTRIGEHRMRRGTESSVRGRFDRIVWFPLDRSEHDAYEGALIRALNPEFNLGAPIDESRDDEVLDAIGLHIDRDGGRRAFAARIAAHWAAIGERSRKFKAAKRRRPHRSTLERFGLRDLEAA